MKIVVAYNDDLALKPHLNDFEKVGEEEVVGTAREVAETIGGTLLPVRDVRSAIDHLRRNRPDVVFNLCEGVMGNPRWEMHFALALEMLGIPFTGCDPIATGICGDKWLTKRLLATAGIPVPRGYVVDERGSRFEVRGSKGETPRTSNFEPRTSTRTNVTSESDTPADLATFIVKPSLEDAGIGIDAESVCRTPAEIAARCAHVIETYRQPALVEEFVDGRELNQALFHGTKGLTVLPAGEIIFADDLAPEQRVVGWKAKWADGSAEDRATVNRTPGVMTDTLRREVANTCTAAASVLSLRGYCRFDVRQRPTGELCVIDVNPNPDIGRNTGFRKALAAAGIEFRDFLDQLMISALSAKRA